MEIRLLQKYFRLVPSCSIFVILIYFSERLANIVYCNLVVKSHKYHYRVGYLLHPLENVLYLLSILLLKIAMFFCYKIANFNTSLSANTTSINCGYRKLSAYTHLLLTKIIS